MKILAGFVLLCLLAYSTEVYLGNVDCGAYVDYIATDPGLYRYDPMYINLHRCHGKFFSVNPHNRKCLPKPENIQLLNITVFTRDGQPQILVVQNHTSCSQKCILSQKDCNKYQLFKKDECDCICNKTVRPVCPEPFKWDALKCDCTCQKQPVACGPRKEYSQEECGCTCKDKYFVRCAKGKNSINKDTCYCEGPVVYASQTSGCDGGVNGAMLAVIILGEAFIIVVCYYFFYIYCYKHNYLGRKAEKANNSGYYHNGDISCDARVMNGGTYYTTGYDDDYNVNNEQTLSDKERIKYEEENDKKANYTVNENNHRCYQSPEKTKYPYCAEEEKSPLTNDDDYYMYKDIMEVDGPPSNDDHNLNIPPDYSDCVSDLTSEEGYASVTQV